VELSTLVADVLVVDDQAAWRSMLCELVAAVAELELVGQAASGEEALDAAERLTPQLVLMDIRMPGIGGFEATRRLTERHADTVVLLVSVDGRDADAVRASGAAGVIRKQEITAEALEAAWRAHRPG
jgi:two-component system, NarL family, invasion response regulator UvrY